MDGELQSVASDNHSRRCVMRDLHLSLFQELARMETQQGLEAAIAELQKRINVLEEVLAWRSSAEEEDGLKIPRQYGFLNQYQGENYIQPIPKVCFGNRQCVSLHNLKEQNLSSHRPRDAAEKSKFALKTGIRQIRIVGPNRNKTGFPAGSLGKRLSRKAHSALFPGFWRSPERRCWQRRPIRCRCRFHFGFGLVAKEFHNANLFEGRIMWSN